MGKTRGVNETTPEIRNRMVGMYEAGLGLREIAAAGNCSQRTVKRWLNRFEKEGTVETRDRCGRKRATTVEQDEAIIRLATQTPITAAKTVLPTLGLSCSVDTIRERLHKAGIHNWSPSKKHMQKIPLGEADGAAIQQAVWRPTGTQLGKKKSTKDLAEDQAKKSTSTSRKRPPRKRKGTTKQVTLAEEVNQAPTQHLNFDFQEQDPLALPGNDVHQVVSSVESSLTTNPGQFHPNVVPTMLPPHSTNIYVSPGSGMEVVQQQQQQQQNWPLDLVQNSHFTQNQGTLTQHASQHSMQRILGHPELEPHNEQNMQQQQMPGLQQTHAMKQPDLPRAEDVAVNSVNNHRNCNNGNDNNCVLNTISNKSSRMDNATAIEKKSSDKNKKKGGKVKGTLETSVEIRNRMIGMSEAGLSTLSIALSIDRSERTVKRWLERWNKEGNVQTKERKGRRRITTQEEDDAIISLATQNPLTAAKFVASTLGLKCSVDTIRERLHKAGIHSWKLGKKQGEGNAVHTVHLWQPSGNRPNKPKSLSERNKKASNGKKQHRKTKDNSAVSKKSVSCAGKVASTKIKQPENVVQEAQNLQFHDQSQITPYVSTPSIMQPMHNLSSCQAMMQPQIPPQDPVVQPIIGPMMQPQQHQRSMTSIGQTCPPCQPSNSIVYTSCITSNNGQSVAIEPTDSINYEPYIWSF